MDSLGSGLFQAAGVIYFVSVVGLDPAVIGATISAANICGLISPVPVGWLVDRFGVSRIYQAMLVVRAFGYAVYPFAANIGAYVLLTCSLTALERACSPQMQVLVGEIETAQDRTRTMASIRTMRNAGLTLGLLLGGSIIALGTRTAFVTLFAANSVSFLLLAAALRRIAHMTPPATATEHGPATAAMAAVVPAQPVPAVPAQPGPVVPTATGAPAPARGGLYRDTRYLLLCAGNAIMSLHDSVLFVLLPIWVVRSAHLPASMSSVLLAINTALTVLLQIYVARFSQGVRASLRLIRWATVLLVGSCLLFLAAEGRMPTLAAVFAVLAIVVLSVGENLHSVAGWELSYDLSPATARSQYLGLFNSMLTVQMILGPIVMTALILRLGAVGWLAMAGLFVVSLWLTAAAVRPALRESVGPDADTPPTTSPQTPVHSGS